jgi:murein DD-endopeptidase MepM/ murein hydrolase activator NlpD
MMNNTTDGILKSQQIARRKNGYKSQGADVLKGIDQIHQRPFHKKRSPPPRTAAFQSPDTDVSGQAHIHVEKNSIFRPNTLVFCICVLALGAFSYYALLWSDNRIHINPQMDSYTTRRNMLTYALSPMSEQLPIPETIPLALNETFSWSNYTVKKGDSVSKIAADNNLSLDAIIASNGLQNARLLREGEVLRIPNMDGIPYTIARGDSYQKIAEKMNVALEAILDANDIQDDNIRVGEILFLPGAKMRSDDLKMALGELFMYPIRGRLTSPFGWRRDPFTGQRRYHSAVDISAATGVPVKATSEGKVTTVAYSAVFGNYIIITHSGGFQSMYAHLNSTSVREGVSVNQGQTIGAVGNTGRSTGPHLHFAIYRNGRAVNPLEYIK